MTNLRETTKIGLIAGAIALSVSMIGLVEGFDARDIITNILSLGQLLLYSIPLLVGYLATKQYADDTPASRAITGGIAGALAGVPILILLLLNLVWEGLRNAFINVSPTLIGLLTFGMDNTLVGGIVLIIAFAILGAVGGAATLVRPETRRPLLTAFGWAAGIGVMSDIFVNIFRSFFGASFVRIFFGQTGLKVVPFVVLLGAITAFIFYWHRTGGDRYHAYRAAQSPQQSQNTNRAGMILLILGLIVLPWLIGVYLTEIINIVALYVLMGLGLNIAVGLAGLLDLGYVTNFAVGAYLMAILTSSSEFGIAAKAGVGPMNFWLALPICILAAMLTGFVFALPVIRMRGDYLAIATLGFGEIIRVLAKSDAMKGVIGGAQGILQVPAPTFFGTPLNTPPKLYYLMIAACLLMLFVSYRLNNSRTGRRWMSIREDEDVSNAMGINTTTSKVLAFTLSAASGGLAGAIFASKLGSIFPSSFQLLISINVLSLIIVGGLGSIPGIIVGAFALVGVPELLREFSEYRLLLYGIALIVMMLVRPEGLWP
jgi:branched-chain amino acid transport system permease protein